MRFFFCTILLFILSSLGSAQAIDERTLTVSGEGYVTAVSDQAYIFIGFETKGLTALEALERHEREVTRIKQALLYAGVQEDAMRIERMAIGAQNAYGYSGTQDQQEGQLVTQRLVVTTQDIGRVEELVSTIAQEEESDSLEDLLDIPQRTVEVQYTIGDPSAYEDEALEEAIRRARRRAELSASHAGVSLGKVLVLREHGVFGTLAGGLEEMAELSTSMAGYPILAGEQRISARVIMSFEIE